MSTIILVPGQDVERKKNSGEKQSLSIKHLLFQFDVILKGYRDLAGEKPGRVANILIVADTDGASPGDEAAGHLDRVSNRLEMQEV